MKKIYIIIINYNDFNVTRECIESLKKVTYENFRIVLIDNGSEDGSIEYFKKDYADDIVMLTSKVNVGFSGGSNIGMKFALENDADYIMLLNNDTEVSPDFLDILMQYANEYTAVIPKIYYYDDPARIWYGGGDVLLHKGQAVHYHIGEYDENPNEYDPLDCTFATGCCLLLSRGIIEKVGLLDENYFMYCEDMDYCIRLRQAGYIIKYVPAAKIWHKVSAGSGGEDSPLSIYYCERNRMYLINKYKRLFYPWGCLYASIKRTVKILIYYLTFDNKREVILKAIRDYKKGLMGKQNFE